MTSDPGLQFQAVDAFVDLVDTLGLGGPLVLSVDDLQWTVRALELAIEVRWWVPIWSVLRSIPVSKNGRSRWRPLSPTWRNRRVPSFTGAARCRGLLGRDAAMLLAVPTPTLSGPAAGGGAYLPGRQGGTCPQG